MEQINSTDGSSGLVPDLPRVEILGLPICSAGNAPILKALLADLHQGRTVAVATPNAEMLLLARRKQEVRDLLRSVDLCVADGVGLVQAAKWLAGAALERYAGIDLAQDLLQALAAEGGRVYLLGAGSEVAAAAAANLTRRYPGINIVGHRDGYFTAADERAIAEGIGSAGADLLLVGMGCPKQEGFIVKYRELLGAGLQLGIGGALEVWAGRKGRAPAWVQALRLEWLYRTFQDPGRIGRTLSLFSFVALVWSEKRRLRAAGGRGA
jgi:N-acetylglucosaminyldiphosphoundecaprenol N-acetyl-beta-D-mannosaminyltransferase